MQKVCLKIVLALKLCFFDDYIYVTNAIFSYNDYANVKIEEHLSSIFVNISSVLLQLRYNGT